MSTITERLQLLITASGGKSVASEIKTVESASGGAAQKTSLLTTAQQKLGIEGASTGAIMKGALAGGIAIGGAALAKFAADGVEKFASLTSEVRGFQRVSGASAEDASRLNFAVKEMGIAPDTAASAFGRLATKLGTGKANLEQYGVEVARNKDGTVDLAGTVANLSQAYQSTNDAGEKAAIGNEAFGKSWQKLAPLLGKGKEDLQGLYAEAAKDHQIFSQTDLENGRKLALATTQLKDAWTGLEVELGSALAPTVASVTSGITQSIHTADEATSSVGGLAGAYKLATDAANPLVLGSHGLAAASALASGEFGKATEEFGRSLPVMGAVIDVFDSGEEASNKFGDAQKRQQDATLNLSNAVAEHGRHSKEARDAEKELTDASSALEGMQHKVSGALEDVNDKLTTHTEKLYADQQASLVAAGDKIALGNAVAQVGSGLDSLNEQLVGNMIAGDNSKAATDRVSQSQRDLAAEAINVSSAFVKQAVDALPANTTQQERTKAATDAQTAAFQYLYAQFPGLREAVQGYVGELGTIPGSKNTTIGADTSPAHAALDALSERINRLVFNTYTIPIGVRAPDKP